MPVKEIARELQGKAANLAVRLPIAWINILAGPPATADGRTLDGRSQWLLQLLARSGQAAIEQGSVAEARAGYDAFMLEMGGRPPRSARSSIAPSTGRPAACACASTVPPAAWPGSCRPSSISTAAAG